MSGGLYHSFVTALMRNGKGFVYSSYLGGSADDYASAITVDLKGNAYVTGQTTSSDFPVRNAFQSTYQGLIDAFVVKISLQKQERMTHLPAKR